jgi:multicomponent Na+:H+ antiporter subunit G
MIVAVGALLIAGSLFIIVGNVGILRLPDFFTRLHAMGKCDTLGVWLVVGGLVLLEGFSHNSLKMLLILVFVGLANPTATHALGRAALRAGLRPWVREEDRDASTGQGGLT